MIPMVIKMGCFTIAALIEALLLLQALEKKLESQTEAASGRVQLPKSGWINFGLW